MPRYKGGEDNIMQYRLVELSYSFIGAASNPRFDNGDWSGKIFSIIVIKQFGHVNTRKKS